LLPKSLKGIWSALIIVGSLLIAITSLDFIYSVFLGVWLSTESLAFYSLYSGFIFKGLNYLAFLLIGIGLLLFNKKVKVVLNKNA
jgi:hypothetical protein